MLGGKRGSRGGLDRQQKEKSSTEHNNPEEGFDELTGQRPEADGLLPAALFDESFAKEPGQREL